MYNAVVEFCRNYGIGIEPSPAYAPPINVTGKCWCKSIVQDHWTRARVFLFAANLPNGLCSEAIQHANWLLNQLPAQRIGGEILFGAGSRTQESITSLSLSLEFEEALSSAEITQQKGRKLLARSVIWSFVGMLRNTALIKVFIPETRTFLCVRRIDFKKLDSLPGSKISWMASQGTSKTSRTLIRKHNAKLHQLRISCMLLRNYLHAWFRKRRRKSI